MAQKPFACTSAGCPMTFTNEDHLFIHQKKHDMNLSLELNCKSGYVADQTPTPTRFIRNCEEVGLFQDLQNVNPFDETFRKAVETGKVGSLHVPSKPQDDDTLHTPQIYPPLEETNRNSYPISRIPSIDENLLPAEEKTEIIFCELSKPENVKSEYPIAPLNLKNNLLLRRLTSKNGDLEIIRVNGEEKSLEPNNGSEFSMKEKNNLILKKLTSKSDLEIIEITEEDNSEHVERDVKSKIKDALMNREKSIDQLDEDRESLIIVDEDFDELNIKQSSRNNSDFPNKLEKRRAINRAAQSRSRARKKSWLDNMEKQMEKIKTSNEILQAENQTLKSEIETLKKVLLLHEDCIKMRHPSVGEDLHELLKKFKRNHDKPKELSAGNKKFVPIAPQQKLPAQAIAFIPTVSATTSDNNTPAFKQFPLAIAPFPVVLPQFAVIQKLNTSPDVGFSKHRLKKKMQKKV